MGFEVLEFLLNINIYPEEYILLRVVKSGGFKVSCYYQTIFLMQSMIYIWFLVFLAWGVFDDRSFGCFSLSGIYSMFMTILCFFYVHCSVKFMFMKKFMFFLNFVCMFLYVYMFMSMIFYCMFSCSCS